MQQGLPVIRHASLWARNSLRIRMPSGRLQLHSPHNLLFFVVVEPGLERFIAGYDRVAGLSGMFSCMSLGRTVTASNLSTLCAPAQMKPPSAIGQALFTTVATWLRALIDPSIWSIHCQVAHFVSDSVAWLYSGAVAETICDSRSVH